MKLTDLDSVRPSKAEEVSGTPASTSDLPSAIIRRPRWMLWALAVHEKRKLVQAGSKRVQSSPQACSAHGMGLHLLGRVLLVWPCVWVGSVVNAGTPQSIAFPAISGKTTVDEPFVLTASASSGIAVSYSIVSPGGVATLSGSTVTLSGTVGSVTVKASQAGNGTFDPAESVYRTFTVRQASFSVLAQGSSAAHRLGIKSDGTLWAWGSNSAGQIGNGAITAVFSPVQITVQTNWSTVSVGGETSAAIRAGTLWTWGRNSSGQLGL